MNKNYNKGRAFEYKVKKWLEERGWLCIRSAGSKSPFDLIALKAGITLAIQCKYCTKITNKELKHLGDLKDKLDPYYQNDIQIIIAEGEPRKDIEFREVGYNGKEWSINYWKN